MTAGPETAPSRAVVRTVLPNGVTLLVRHDPAAEAVAIVTWVRAGYFDEPDAVGGIAHVLEHMYFKGTPRFGPGEIATATKACGGFLNAATIYDHTAYYAVVPAARFETALDIQHDAWANSRIDADELRRELEVIIQEAQRKRDSPGAVAVETLFEVLHDRHRMRRWRIGHEDVLRRLTRDDVLGFHRTHYGPANTILAIVGHVDPAAVLSAVAARHGTAAPHAPPRDRGPVETTPPGRRWREWAGDIANAELVLGWRTVPPTHADAAPLALAADVLGTGRGSRLWRAVRERGLAPAISASHYTPTELGVFVVHGDAPPATAESALRTMWQEVQRLARDGPAPHELERVRRLHAVRRRRRLESMDGQAMELARWEALGDETWGDAWEAQLAACTPATVREALARWCAPDQVSVVVYRPHAMSPVGGDADGFARLEPPVPLPPPVPPPDVPATLPAAPAEWLEQRDGVHVFRTRRGVPLLVQHVPGMPIVHLGASLLGGAATDAPHEAGLSLLAARTMARATTTLEAAAMAATTEWLGGGIAASGGADTMGWYCSVPPDAFAPAAQLLADVVLRPRLDAETIATERRVMIVDAVQLRDDMARWPMRLAIDA
ncbi:MAG: insulinase family protein, partial [Gemmatimonadaceae bacterium]|nr:insulinase family protein [Gemmatimonadaceae bacterium]